MLIIVLPKGGVRFELTTVLDSFHFQDGRFKPLSHPPYFYLKFKIEAQTFINTKQMMHIVPVKVTRARPARIFSILLKSFINCFNNIWQNTNKNHKKGKTKKDCRNKF